jgi:hypothetical protein
VPPFQNAFPRAGLPSCHCLFFLPRPNSAPSY